MFNYNIINNLNISKKWAFLSWFLWIVIFALSIYILKIWVDEYNIWLNWDNLTYIFWWLAISWLILIITPMYFWFKDREIEKEIEIKKIENIANYENKKEILEKLKNIINNNNKTLSKKYKEFSTTRNKWDWKLLKKEKNYELNIWLWDDDDFWRFYIYTKNYNSLPKKIKDNFIEIDLWKEDSSYPYKESFSNYENLEKQFIEIDKILWNSK